MEDLKKIDFDQVLRNKENIDPNSPLGILIFNFSFNPIPSSTHSIHSKHTQFFILDDHPSIDLRKQKFDKMQMVIDREIKSKPLSQSHSNKKFKTGGPLRNKTTTKPTCNLRV